MAVNCLQINYFTQISTKQNSFIGFATYILMSTAMHTFYS